MADEKKKDDKKKDDKGGASKPAVATAVSWLMSLGIVGFFSALIIIYKFATHIVGNLADFVENLLLYVDLRNVDATAKTIVVYSKILAVLIAIYAVILQRTFIGELKKVKAKLDAMFSPPPLVPIAADHTPIVEPPSVKLWKRVQQHINSENPNDWKIAIIEADTILDELVERMGYAGVTLGERMKRIEKSDFLSLDDAWEAHKVRNAIAHDASFQLSEREARRVIALYENVFKEFDFL